jgi:hypothetical protein
MNIKVLEMIGIKPTEADWLLPGVSTWNARVAHQSLCIPILCCSHFVMMIILSSPHLTATLGCTRRRHRHGRRRILHSTERWRLIPERREWILGLRIWSMGWWLVLVMTIWPIVFSSRATFRFSSGSSSRCITNPRTRTPAGLVRYREPLAGEWTSRTRITHFVESKQCIYFHDRKVVAE